MSNDWDSIFSGQAKPTGVASAAKPAANLPTEDIADDLFSLLDNESGGDDPDDSQQPAALSVAKSTLAQIMQEQSTTAPPVPTQSSAEPEKKRRGRGPNKKEPVTAEKFVGEINKLPGGSQAAETLFSAPVAAPELPGTPESTEAAKRENVAIEASIRFLAGVLIRRLQS